MKEIETVTKEWEAFVKRNNKFYVDRHLITRLFANAFNIKTIISQTICEMRKTNEGILDMKAIEPKIIFKDKKILCIHFNVKGPYFDARQGLTFHDDNTMEIAGWTDNENVKPFIEALRRVILFLEGKYIPDYRYALLSFDTPLGVFAETAEGDKLLATVPKHDAQIFMLNTIMSNMEYDLEYLQESLDLEIHSIYTSEVD